MTIAYLWLICTAILVAFIILFLKYIVWATLKMQDEHHTDLY